MIRTIYKCDKCGKEQDTAEQFWTVGIFARAKDRYPARSSLDESADRSLEVCRPCLESLGVHVQKVNPPAVQPPVASLEDRIREIAEMCGIGCSRE